MNKSGQKSPCSQERTLKETGSVFQKPFKQVPAGTQEGCWVREAHRGHI